MVLRVLWTHINTWCWRVKFFPRNGGLHSNIRFDRECREQVRLLEFPFHPSSPKKRQKHLAHQKMQKCIISSEILPSAVVVVFFFFKQYLLASSDHFSGCVLNVDHRQWDSLLLHFWYVECLSPTTLHFNQEDLQLLRQAHGQCFQLQRVHWR